ncbi:spectrin beta chain, non-erythrocytic 1-like isoform X1 [Chiloscyllium punctatum]|uniref:spectrin beta chain, non-erythrocytic 1-like isoform X1 n=1 Tax=Chiloscyllium punctatum TaxID=137246 RepID=UPI003B63C3A0
MTSATDFDNVEIQQQYSHINARWELSDEGELDNDNSSARLFERSRIKALSDEREVVQKKTFTKWVNSHLARVTCRITDLYTDLRDGRMLIKLLEILSGEHLPKPTKGRMRIHCLENVDKALQFLKEQKVHLENMGSHDIVDGSHRLTLGLIWTIILRFQIQDITVETHDNRETRSAKDALLLWCQMKTAGYPNVNIRNFTSSWKDGMAFNALIHKHRPDLVDFNKLKQSNATYNLQQAFNIAEQQLGVTKLLDPEDVYTENPDEKSIITYVVAFYHYFSKMKALAVEGKRIGKVLDNAIETQKMIDKYEQLASDLLIWIEQTIIVLNSRKFANSLAGVQQQLQAFNTYRTVEKPSKFQEKGNLEVLLFSIQSRMRANNQKVYTPHEGKLISDINRGWERLEKAEHERELALRNELIRQEKLEQLARRFDRKALMRETWLCENQRLVSQDNFGYDLSAVEAAMKKHEAIEADIAAYEERVQTLVDVSLELEAENYHDIKRINARKDNIMRLWEYLLELLNARRARLEMNLALQKIFQEMLHIIDWMDEMKVRLLSQDFGKHLMGVEDLLQKHTLVEADIAIQADRLKLVNAGALKFAEDEGYTPCDPNVIKDRVNHLELCYEELCVLAAERKARLEQSRCLWRFFWEMAETEGWIREREQIFSSQDYGKDITSIVILQSKHKALEDELGGLSTHLQQTIKEGRDMIAQKHFASPEIKKRIDEVLAMWKDLEELAAFRKQNLQDAQNFFQFQVDADDVKIWLQDTYRIVSSDDVGHDEFSTQTLVKKHRDLTDEIMKSGIAIDALNKQLQSLPEEFRKLPEIKDRQWEIKELYADLVALADLRRQRLQDALALYIMFSEADACELWMNEKEKWLEGVEIPKKLDDLEVVEHRFETLVQEMNNLGSRITEVNSTANHLVETGHPSTQEVKECQDHVNLRWLQFQKLVDMKKNDVQSALSLQNYCLECDETKVWICEKTKLIESTQSLEKDLPGVLAIQRKLCGIERDLAAIESRLPELQKEAHRLADQHPHHAADILKRLKEINDVWDELKHTLQGREESLGEASKLQKFLQDLDDFQLWLSKSQKAIASEDEPNSLPEAETLLQQHNAIKNEIDRNLEEYQKIQENGKMITEGETDPQFQILKQRLEGVDTGWNELLQMWENRKNLLSQSHGYQQFLRDSKQADSILRNQEYSLVHVEMPKTLETAEDVIKKHEGFVTTMDANREKIIGTINEGEKLINEDNNFKVKVVDKIQAIKERYQENMKQAKEVAAHLKDNRDLQHFLQNCQELIFWINEKMLTAQDTSYDEARNLHTKWQKHQAFMAELASNKEWLDKVEKEGKQLMEEKPEFKPQISEKLQELTDLWNVLDVTTESKAKRLFDANRSELFAQTRDDLNKWLTEVELQLHSDDFGKDLTSVNILLKKLQILENQVDMRKKEVEELLSQTRILSPEGLMETDGKEQDIERRFLQLMGPLQERRQKLHLSKMTYQFYRDLEDEILWVQERMSLATSTDHGHNLQTVHLLMKKNKTLQKEIQGHQPRIDDVLERGEAMVVEQRPDSVAIEEQLKELKELWNKLQEEAEKRQKRLEGANEAQQYYMDAAEAEIWMSEQELYMIADEKTKDEAGATTMLKKHLILQQAILDYGNIIREMADRAQKLLTEEHPEGEQIIRRQGQVDKLYAGLRDLANERKKKLEDICHLLQLNREVMDLEQWIAERDVAASSQELGQDYDQVTLLREKFREFARETGTIGQERVDSVNLLIDDLIDSGHSEAADIAEWKDSLNEAWADLLELIDTRTQLLTASFELHKYFYDGKELLSLIQEKHEELPEDLGRDANTAESFHRMHSAFERDIHSLGIQVQQFQDDAGHLQTAYAGDKAAAIQKQEQEVVEAWKALLDACDGRRTQLVDTAEKFRFFSMVRDLMSWMESIIRQVETEEKPRDVSSVELLMKYHQGIRAEIDARNRNFTSCIDLGKTMLARNHHASEEIRDKLVQLTEKRKSMMDKWEERWCWLRLLLEVCQFARDASVAEAWLITQESYLNSRDIGNSVDQVEKLIKKHEAFEKSTATWDERFSALERLTTLELLEIRKKQEAFRQTREVQLQPESELDHDQIPPDTDQQPADQTDVEKTQEEEWKMEGPKGAELTPHVTDEPSLITTSEDLSALVNGTDSPEEKTLESEDKSEFEEKLRERASKPPPLVLSELEQEKPRVSSTLPILTPKEQPAQCEGYLARKHELEGPNKKASNRSWITLYCALKSGELYFYKDSKNFSAGVTYHGADPLNLKGASCEVAADYKKKKHVFKLRLNNGSEYLFHDKDEEELHNWIRNLNAAIAEQDKPQSTRHGEVKAHTLPLPTVIAPETSPGKKDKEKRFSLFAKKK